MEKISIYLEKIITLFEYKGFKIINKKDDVDSYININDKNIDSCIDIRDGYDSDYDEKHDDNNNTTNDSNTTNDKKSKKTRKCIQISDVRISPFAMQRKYLVELLIIRDGEKEHYLSIRNISRLLHGSNYDRGMYCFKKCYCSFRTPEILNKKHISLWTDNEKALKIMPKRGKNDIVKFKDHCMKLLQPFMIIADFETYTDLLGYIKPYSFPMFTHCIFDNEKTLATRFYDNLIRHVEYVDKSRAEPKPHCNVELYDSNPEFATCLICNKIINDRHNAHEYRYYCRKTGYLLRFKHQQCRDLTRRTKDITVLFHNGSKFDLRLILKYLAEKCNSSNISCIAQSKETFYSLAINSFAGKNIRLKFIDSNKHLTFSLDKLTNYLSSNYNHKDTSKETINKLKQNFFYLCIVILLMIF